tara:strand:+ start:44849 stop:48829 length:3981 start_codon:yes stop_codon:yes gene_type:complete
LEKRQLLAGDIALAHNYVHSLDVDDNYQITPRDALIVVNYLSRHGSGQEITEFDESMNFVDVNGDGMVTANDALRVINGLQAGEGVGETVELVLNARTTDDVEITPDGSGDINVGVGEIFHLELGYQDLRGAFNQLGVAKYIADIGISADGVLIPALTETQQLGFTEEILGETQGTVTFSLAGSTDTVDVPVSDFLASLSAPATQTKNAVVQLGGYDPDEISAEFLDLRQNDPNAPADDDPDLFVQVRYLGEDNIDVDFPMLQVTVTGTAQTIFTSEEEFNPRNGDGTINGAAVPFNIIADSRSVAASPDYFGSIPTGGYSETGGFDDLGGVNFDGPPNESPYNADLSQPFDAISIPVRVIQEVQDLVVSLNPSNDEAADIGDEGIILWRDNDPIPVDQILTVARASITINATAAAGFQAGDSTQNINEDDANITIDLSTLVTGGTADTFAITTNGTLGNATLSGTTLTYDVNADANGTDTIVYTATSGTDSDTGTITVNVAPVNDAPVANGDSVATTVDTALTIQVADLIANDTDVENDTLTITAVGTPATSGATAVLNGSTITYTPASGSTTTDTFTYTLSDGTDTATGTVTVTINAQQVDPPIADDDSLAATEDTVATLDLSTLLSGGAFSTLAVTTNGSIGSASISGTTLTYTPNADANGSDTIVYTATNAGGSDTGTIAVTVAAVNDAPVANADSVSTTVNTPLTIQVADLIANDTDVENDTLTITAVGTPSNTGATAVLNGSTITYTPATNSNTSDSFTYTLSDGTDTATGTVSVTVSGVVTAPIAGDGVINTSENTNGSIDLSTLLSGGTFDTLSITTNGTNGTASISGTTLTYSPNADFNGTDTIVYTATNGIGSDSGTISVTVSEVNNPPTSGPVTVAATEDTPVTFDAATILANASPGSGEASQSVTITGVTASTSQGGTATINGSGGIDYAPAANFFGSDTFTVTITDNGTPAESVDFVVTVNVASVNDAPTAGNDSASVLSGSSVQITVLANDSAGPANENQTLTVVSATSSQGSTTINANGTLTFTPNDGFVGTATIAYTVEDSDNAQASATVTVDVQDFLPSTVSGSIFIDLVNNPADVPPPTNADPIRDGIKSENEDGLSGIPVRLVPTGETSGSTTTVYTDMDGGYLFTNVAPGTYNVVYDLPATVVYVGATTTPISIGAAGGESASGGNVGSLGLSGGLTNLDILVSSYMRANPDVSGVSNGGLQGGSVGLNASGEQTLFKAAEGFEDVDFAELTLNESRDSALLTIIEDGVVKSAQLPEEYFVVSRDGTAVQFFGGKEDFDFSESLSDLITSEYENYRNAIDKVLGGQ